MPELQAEADGFDTQSVDHADVESLDGSIASPPLWHRRRLTDAEDALATVTSIERVARLLENLSTDETLLTEEAPPGNIIGPMVSSPTTTTAPPQRKGMLPSPKPGPPPLAKSPSLRSLSMARTLSRSGIPHAKTSLPTPVSPAVRNLSSSTPTMSFSPDPILTEDEDDGVRPPMPSPLPTLMRTSSRSSLLSDRGDRSSSMRQKELKDFTDNGVRRWNAMISYCWDDVRLPCDPRRIAQHLNEFGVSTWLDIERLDSRRSVFDQLIDGVLRSDVIIVCVSKAWSRSKICNKEFRLIAQLQLPVVIVLLEMDLRPNCWRRIARVTLDNVVVVDAGIAKPEAKRIRAALDTILQETRWVMSRVSPAVTVPPSPPPSPSPAGRKRASSTVELPGLAALRWAAQHGDDASRYRLGVLNDAHVGATVGQSAIMAHHWFSLAAESGHKGAMYRLGNLFERGRGVARDEAAAAGWYERAFSEGCVDAGAAIAADWIKRGGEGDDDVGRRILEACAEKGSIRAMFKLGILCHDRREDEASARWFQRCADWGDDGVAMFNLGTYFERGLGVPMDLTEARKWYERAAEMRFEVDGGESSAASLHALFNLGVFWERGIDGEQDMAKAVAYYKEAAAGGHLRAIFNYGVCLKKGRGTEKNGEESVRCFFRASELGHADAQFNLGNCYKYVLLELFNSSDALSRYGEGVEQDKKEAARWYQKASEQGHSKAQFNLGLCYDEGEGIEQDLVESARLFRLSAEAGNAIAQFYYGIALERGRGVERSLASAVAMYTKAAEAGDVEAASSLAHCLMTGSGCERSIEEGFRWLQWAAEQGEPESQHSAGLCLKKGEGCEQDLRAAFTWFKLSARQGHPGACYEVGFAMEFGIGCGRNASASKTWYERAAKGGHAKAKARLGRR